jgi:hypothetical protein
VPLDRGTFCFCFISGNSACFKGGVSGERRIRHLLEQPLPKREHGIAIQPLQRSSYRNMFLFRSAAAIFLGTRGALMMSRITQEAASTTAAPAIELSIKISIPVAAAAMIAAAIRAFLLPFQ